MWKNLIRWKEMYAIFCKRMYNPTTEASKYKHLKMVSFSFMPVKSLPAFMLILNLYDFTGLIKTYLSLLSIILTPTVCVILIIFKSK